MKRNEEIVVFILFFYYRWIVTLSSFFTSWIQQRESGILAGRWRLQELQTAKDGSQSPADLQRLCSCWSIQRSVFSICYWFIFLYWFWFDFSWLLIFCNEINTFYFYFLFFLFPRSIWMPRQGSSHWPTSSRIIQIYTFLIGPRGGSSTWWNAILTCVSSSQNSFLNSFVMSVARRRQVKLQAIYFAASSQLNKKRTNFARKKGLWSMKHLIKTSVQHFIKLYN